MPVWTRRSTPIRNTWGPDQAQLRHNDVRSAIRWALLVVALLAAFEALCGWLSPSVLAGSGDGISLSVVAPLVVAGAGGLLALVLAFGLARRFKLAWLAAPTALLTLVISILGLIAIDGIVEGPAYLDSSPARIVPQAALSALLGSKPKDAQCTWVTVSAPGFVPSPFQRCASVAGGGLAESVSFINNPGTNHANGFIYSSVPLGALPNLCARPVDAHWWAVLSEHYLYTSTTCPYPYSPGPVLDRTR